MSVSIKAIPTHSVHFKTNMMPIQIPNWVMQPEVWRYVGFASGVVGLLCYALSSSFNYLFGEWNLFKIIVYSVLSFIICGTMLFAKKWQLSTNLLLKAHLGVLVLTLTSVYDFFYDKAVNRKPDALSLISSAAFALMSFSLSRQTHLGLEVDLLYFFLGIFIVQLMKIKLLLALVGTGFSYSLLVLRSSLDSQLRDGSLGVEDSVVIQMGASSNGIVLADYSLQPGDALIVQKLTACAEAIEHNDLNLGDRLLREIGLLAVSESGATRKVAIYFAEALARRVYKIYPQEETLDFPISDGLCTPLIECYPYFKFAHSTANQAIFEAFASANTVHVIDLGQKQGIQWPMLIQALALRPGGPPSFRLTVIGPSQPHNADRFQSVGWKLTKLAESMRVEFEFHGIGYNSLADLDPSVLEIRPGETVAVNSVMELHRTLARPGAIDNVLKLIKSVKPTIVTLVEQEANHNGPGFLERFREALQYYWNVFDSVEGCWSGLHPGEDLAMTEVRVGREICNVVGCEGEDRVERHERVSRWRERMVSAGFDTVPLGSNACTEAHKLFGLFPCSQGDGFSSEDDNGCLMLAWHGRPLMAASAWKIADP